MPYVRRIKSSRKTLARRRAQAKVTRQVREYVFERERGICRCCGVRWAESMHEIKPRSLGGKVSIENSIAVCGSGTTKCHGLLQSHRIDVIGDNAQCVLMFEPVTPVAIAWMECNARSYGVRES